MRKSANCQNRNYLTMSTSSRAKLNTYYCEQSIFKHLPSKKDFFRLDIFGKHESYTQCWGTKRCVVSGDELFNFLQACHPQFALRQKYHHGHGRYSFLSPAFDPQMMALEDIDSDRPEIWQVTEHYRENHPHGIST